MYTNKTSSTLPIFPRYHYQDISLRMKNLNPAKGNGCDNISIKINKICFESLPVHFKIMFEEFLKEGEIPELWKKANIVPVHKKEGKNLLKNYCLIILLPIFIFPYFISKNF